MASSHPLQLKMKITDFENRRSFKSIWLNSQFREEVQNVPQGASFIQILFLNACYNFCLSDPFLLFFVFLLFSRRSHYTQTSMAVFETFSRNVKRPWSSRTKVQRSSGTDHSASVFQVHAFIYPCRRSYYFNYGIIPTPFLIRVTCWRRAPFKSD